jgi:hypothetical protein
MQRGWITFPGHEIIEGNSHFRVTSCQCEEQVFLVGGEDEILE